VLCLSLGMNVTNNHFGDLKEQDVFTAQVKPVCYAVNFPILDTIGPCPKGHVFSVSEVTPQGSRAECRCKSFHARALDGACYRLYTRGPCAHDEMIARGGRCTKVICWFCLFSTQTLSPLLQNVA
jgi:hypothetical protein